MDRRRFFQACMAAGITSPLFPGAVLALSAQSASSGATSTAYPHDAFRPITDTMLVDAAAIVGMDLSQEQRTQVLEAVQNQRETLKKIRSLQIPGSVAPAMIFDPRPSGFVMPQYPARSTAPSAAVHAPNKEHLAFATVQQLGVVLRARHVTSVELTKLYLERLKRFDARLHCVITLTEERALQQAAQADHELASGKDRGPLHGIPWGAKDLLSVKGYPTTWGAAGMEHQSFDVDATVVQRLDQAGAVLIAKLSMGALAQGDVWFGGRTRNPWNTLQGSSGSSAGSASAVSAGCVAFAIGSETLGSISSPSTRCGVTGLRPTFGLVPRTGAMSLSWSMDKLGPICRSVQGCTTVLQVIAGADHKDATVWNDAAFVQQQDLDWKNLRVGYFPDRFERASIDTLSARPDPSDTHAFQAWTAQKIYHDMRAYDLQYDRATLDVLRAMGVNLIPVQLPDLPWAAITPVLEAEAAAAFDELTRSGRDSQLTAQGEDDWPNIFRMARFYSAVDYLQAQRARTIAIQKFAELFQQVDVIVTPSTGSQSRATNLTGHPAVIVPNGLRGSDAPKPLQAEDPGGPGTPTSITFLGGLYQEAQVAALAQAYQVKTGFHLQYPPQFV